MKPGKVVCSSPPAGSGTVKTSHGMLPVPVPVVLELARRFEIKLEVGDQYPTGELTTPTGLALISMLVDEFGKPPFWDIAGVGIGLGKLKFDL